MAHSFIIINGKAFPPPARGLNISGAQFVSDGKNANGEFIGHKVGRMQVKLDNFYWPYLTAKQWSQLLAEISTFKLDVVFCHPQYNTWKKLTMYPGNWSCTPHRVDRVTGLTLDYTECKCNFIDYGLLEDV